MPPSKTMGKSKNTLKSKRDKNTSNLEQMPITLHKKESQKGLPKTPIAPSKLSPNKAEFSEPAEKLLQNNNVRNILRLLFSRYTGMLTWKQISQQIFYKDIKLLLNSVNLDLVPGDGSHFKVKKKLDKNARKQEKTNVLMAIPFHKEKTKAIYLKLLSFLLIEQEIYPLALEEKLKELEK